MKQVEKLILREAKGLPVYALGEILDFVQFIKEKIEIKKNKNIIRDNLNIELALLGQTESMHLEKEFKDYRELYPREK